MLLYSCDSFRYKHLYRHVVAKGGSNIRLFKDETSFYVYIYKSTWSRTNIEVFSDNHSKFYFTDVTDQISISDLEEISIS